MFLIKRPFFSGVLIKDASYNYGQTKEKEDFS
jgi:hypothetical protein